MKRHLSLIGLIFLSACSSQKHSTQLQPVLETPPKAETPPPFSMKKLENGESFRWQVVGEYERKEAEGAAKERAKGIATLTDPNINTYLGTDSAPEPCRKEKLPKEVYRHGKHFFSRSLSLFSSESKALGMCLPMQPLLKTQFELLYCAKDKNLYAIQFFYPQDQPWKKEPVAACAP